MALSYPTKIVAKRNIFFAYKKEHTDFNGICSRDVLIMSISVKNN